MLYYWINSARFLTLINHLVACGVQLCVPAGHKRDYNKIKKKVILSQWGR
jgi:hypothetical protein